MWISLLKNFVVEKRHGAMQKKKWEKRNKKIKKEGKRKRWEKIAHVLAKIFHKREIYFKEHSRIKLATKYSPHMHILI